MKKIFTLILIMSFLTLNLTPVHAADTKKLTVEWQQFPSGINGVAIIQTSDGGYLALGKNNAYFLVKTDPTGNISWTKTLPVTEPDSLNIIIKTSDGGYALGGSKWLPIEWQFKYNFSTITLMPQLFILKVDSQGNTQWNQTYQNYDMDSKPNNLQGLIQTSDGGYTVVGSYDAYNGRKPRTLFIKTDNSGNLLFNKTIESGVMSVIQTDDGGYTLIKSQYLAGGGYVLNSIKIDSDGTTQWNKEHPIGFNNEPYCRQAIGTKDGGYLICGTRSTNYANSSGWLAKIDSSGNPVWDNMYGKSRRGIYSVTQSIDGGYFFAAVTEETESSGGNYGGKTLIAKIDDKGNIKGSIEFEANPSFSTNLPSQIIATSDGGCILIGTANYSYTANGNEKFWIAKFAALPYEQGNQEGSSQSPQQSQTPGQSPYLTIGAVAIVIASAIIAGSIMYFKKQNHELKTTRAI